MRWSGGRHLIVTCILIFYNLDFRGEHQAGNAANGMEGKFMHGVYRKKHETIIEKDKEERIHYI
jgi:hypothetical protein